MRMLMGEKRRMGALLAAILLFCSILFMLFFLSHEVTHECSGENCEICFCMDFCVNVISHLKTSAAGLILSAILATGLIFVSASSREKLVCNTLVSMKIRNNN